MKVRREEGAGGGSGLTGQFQVGSKGQLKITCASEEEPSKGKQPRNLHLCVCQKKREESCSRVSHQEDQTRGRTSTLSTFYLRKATRSHAGREVETEEEAIKEVTQTQQENIRLLLNKGVRDWGCPQLPPSCPAPQLGVARQGIGTKDHATTPCPADLVSRPPYFCQSVQV